MTVKGGTTPACAACKYQRRRCIPTCPLAPYFPATQQQKFVNIHKLFGVSNVTNTLQSLETKDLRDDAMTSMMFEADMRESYPVYGCSYVIFQLKRQLEYAIGELMCVRSELEKVKEARVNHNRSNFDIRRYTTSVDSIPGSSDVPTYTNRDFYQSVEDMIMPIPAVAFCGHNARVTSNGATTDLPARVTSNDATTEIQMNTFGGGSNVAQLDASSNGDKMRIHMDYTFEGVSKVAQLEALSMNTRECDNTLTHMNTFRGSEESNVISNGTVSSIGTSNNITSLQAKMNEFGIKSKHPSFGIESSKNHSLVIREPKDKDVVEEEDDVVDIL